MITVAGVGSSSGSVIVRAHRHFHHKLASHVGIQWHVQCTTSAELPASPSPAARTFSRSTSLLRFGFWAHISPNIAQSSQSLQAADATRRGRSTRLLHEASPPRAVPVLCPDSAEAALLPRPARRIEPVIRLTKAILVETRTVTITIASQLLVIVTLICLTIFVFFSIITTESLQPLSHHHTYRHLFRHLQYRDHGHPACSCRRH